MKREAGREIHGPPFLLGLATLRSEFMKIFIAVLCLFTGSVHAAFDFPNIGSLMRPAQTSLKLTGVLEPESDVDGKGGSKSIKQGSADLSVPVYDFEKNRVSIGTNYGVLDPGGADLGVLRRYRKANVKLTYSRIRLDQGLLVADVSYGSESDRLFMSSEVNTLSSTLLYSFPTEYAEGEGGHPIRSWSLFLSYSNNRSFMNGLPLLGFIYSYTPSRDFRLMAGIPFFSLSMRFQEKWEWSSFLLVPFLGRTKLSYDVLPFLQVYGFFDYSQQTFLRYGRTEKTDRVFYDEKKFALGVSGPVARFAKATLEAGYGFDRSFYEARNSLGVKSSRERLGSAPDFLASVELMF